MIRFFATGFLALVIAAGAYGSLQMAFGPRPVEIHVRWAPDVDAAQQQAAERRYSLFNGSLLEGRTWAYTLSDLGHQNIAALVQDEAVEDTQDIDRAALQVSPTAPRRPYLTSHSWLPASLLGATVLGAVIGFVAISLGFVEQVRPGATRKKLTGARDWVTGDPKISRNLALAFTVVLMGLCFLGARTMNLRGDERQHLIQINRFVEGDYAARTGTSGGFHAAAMVVARLTGRSDKETIRAFVLLISMVTIIVFYWVMASIDPGVSTIRTLQFVFFPILFPLWFLIYTDVFALMFLLLSARALLSNRPHLSALSMLTSVVARQTHIVWFAMFGLWTAILNVARPLPQLARRLATFGIGAGLFALFVVANGGIAAGDRDNHPDFGIQTENLLFMLACFFVLFLPLVVSTLPQIKRLHPTLLTGLVLTTTLLFFGTFAVDHPWNSPADDYYLRNRLLDVMTSSPLGGLATCIAITLAVLSLCVIRLRQPVHYLIYPFAVLSVIPIWLIEQRYYLPAFVFFMLFRESASPRIERAIVAVNAVLALGLFVGVQGGWFFL